ncbi:hypothetical protein EDB89DRAFT_1835365, partial [Lactarius sanguifluus]
MALAKGIPTHIHNITKKWTRLDNIFTMEHTLEAITTCNTMLGKQGVNTDHLPIVTTLDLELTKAPTKTLRNFKEVDWTSFSETLKNKINNMGLPTHIQTQNFLNCECDNLTKVIQDMIESVVPITVINAKSKCWWSKELKLLRREVDRTGRKAFKYRSWPDHPIHAEYKNACKKY